MIDMVFGIGATLSTSTGEVETDIGVASRRARVLKELFDHLPKITLKVLVEI